MANRLLDLPVEVMTSSEAREAAPGLAQEFREAGIFGRIVFYGSHRRPDAAIVPAALLEALAPYLEDIVIAARVKARLAEDNGSRISLEDLDATRGWSAEDVAAEVKVLKAELGRS